MDWERGRSYLAGLTLTAAMACGGSEAAPSSAPTEESAEATSAAPTSPAPAAEPEEPAGPSCDERESALRARVQAALEEHASCAFNVDCALVSAGSSCAGRCEDAVHPRGIPAVNALVRELDSEVCPEWLAAECPVETVDCPQLEAACQDGRCVSVRGEAPVTEVPVPEQNRVGGTPARPAGGEVDQERARRLFDAIVADDPALAADFFFPREAFRHVKAMGNPDRYWRRLFARYATDVHALHAELGNLEGAEFERLEIVRRGGWVRRGEEGNALPYWAARHNWLHYRQNGQDKKFEVRVLITWGEAWYITHLSEFH